MEVLVGFEAKNVDKCQYTSFEFSILHAASDYLVQ